MRNRLMKQVRGRLKASIALFMRSRDAGVLPLVALCGMVLIGFVGFALDTGRQTMMQSQLQSSIDAAGLSAVARMNTSEIEEEVERFTQANFFGGFVEGEITQLRTRFSADEETVIINASVEAPSTFMQLFGIPKLRANAYTEITRAMGGLELALVLDVTGSMNDRVAGGITGLQALKQASNDLLDILYAEEEHVDGLHVGIVPFSGTVNIGSARSHWLRSRPSGWAGCVQARPGDLDTTDATPAAGGMFTGSGPDNQYCPSPMTPLTSSKSTLKQGISKLKAAGWTHINYGAVWGWRMLSPAWRGSWGGTMGSTLPLDYEARNMKKAMVIMTDGANAWGQESDAYPGICIQQRCTRSLFGRCREYECVKWDLQGRLGGASTRSEAKVELDNRLEQLCAQMRAREVTVYTVAFGGLDANVQKLMRDCASNEAYFFNSPSASDLRTAFAKIGDSLASLRVSR